MASVARKTLLVTDLDNTLWDWFEAWFQSFSGMLDRLCELSGVPREVLEYEIRQIHRARGTAEYSNLLREVPSLISAAAPGDPAEVYIDALHILRSRRKSATRLYPGVMDGLISLQKSGVRIAAYTESIAYWTEWRIKHTGLDGVIDVLYSAPDHDLPPGITVADLRTLPPASYQGFSVTVHNQVPAGLTKPNLAVLQSILEDQSCDIEQAVYLGDSLMKDIAMAQSAGVLDVHATYGVAQNRPEYDLLRRVTHWTDQDVERERLIAASTGDIVPTLRCLRSFAEILPVFGLD